VRITAIVQARMGSTRLPGKVLMDLGGKTVLARVVQRLRRARLLHEIVVATTVSPADAAIAEECDRLGVRVFRGSEDDVLERYYRAAAECGSEAILRITADCPVIDGELVDAVIQLWADEKVDYASNGLRLTFPRGLDAEVFRRDALERAWREARLPHQREHVTPYFYEHPELFSLASLVNGTDYSHDRWTLDTDADLELLRAIYQSFGNRDQFRWKEIIQLMEREPQLCALNAHVVQKAVPA